MVEGRLQREGEVIHVIVSRCYNFSKLLLQLTSWRGEDLSLKPLSRSDETTAPVPDAREKKPLEEVVQGKIFPEGRNFR